MATTQELIDSLNQDKQNLVSMLNNMGVEANNSETFTSLTPKVGKIVTDPILQDKAVEITENGTTTITADNGYDGLNNVEVTTNVASGGTINVFVQEDEPTIKEGIWFEKSEYSYPKIRTINKPEQTLDVPQWYINNEFGTLEYPAYGGYGACTVGDVIYLFDGYASSTNNLHKRIQKYDTNTQKVSSTSNILTIAGTSISLAAHSEDIYMFGGLSGSSASNSAHKFNTQSETITTISNMPEGRFFHATATVGDDIYLFGGKTNTGYGTSKTVYKYNTTSDTYTKLSDFPSNACVDNSTFVDGTDIYIIGGFEYKTDYSTVGSNSVYKYDTLTDTYTQMTNYPDSDIYQLFIAKFNGAICCFNKRAGMTNVYEFDITNNTFILRPELQQKHATVFPKYASCNNVIYKFSDPRDGTDYYNKNITALANSQVLGADYEEDCIILCQPANSQSFYETQLATFDNTANRILYKFTSAYCYTVIEGLDLTTPTYYGDGTQWIKFKN